MAGGTGNDTYYVDNAADQVFEAAGGGTDNVYTSANFGLAAGQEVEYLRAYGAGVTSGLTLTGNELANYLIGGAGNDALNGGAGNDRLNGGSGLDTFVFNTSIAGGTNVDTIEAFNAAEDTINLDDAFFAGLTPGALNSSQFALNTATGAGPQIVYNTASGALFLDSNGATAGGATQFAILSGHPSITASDFWVV